MKANFRIIGDVHGKHGQYHLLIRKAKFTLQIGDFGFDYETLSSVDPKRHRVIGGNHDNYDKVGQCPNFLGDYGIHNIPEFGDIFFVRGALSVDRHIRTESLDWWPEEELSIANCYAAIALYSKVKPEFVVTHTCPITIVPHVMASSYVIPSRTGQLLEEMFAIHQPKRWVFGHYHRSWSKTIDGTSFTCLNELECLNF